MIADRDAVLRVIGDRVWAIERRSLESMVAALQLGETIEAVKAVRSASASARQRARGVGVIPIVGPLEQRPSLFSAIFGGSSAEQIGNDLATMLGDRSVDGIVLDVDSPGGDVSGITELAAAIRAARKHKPIVAVANAMAASAAYWLASQADRLLVTPSGWVGAIGVLSWHDDLSGAFSKAGVAREYVSAGRYKTEVTPLGPLDDSARAHEQALVDSHYATFVADVGLGRNVSPATVRSGFGQGRMLTASAAKRAGMVDDIGAMQDVLSAPGGVGIRSAGELVARIRARHGLSSHPVSWYRARRAVREGSVPDR